jgi:hypothetical protein
MNFWLGTDLGFRVLGPFSTNSFIENEEGISKALMSQFNNLIQDGDMQEPGTSNWTSFSGGTATKVIDGTDGNVQVMKVTDTSSVFGVDQTFTPTESLVGKRLIVFIEGRSEGDARIFAGIRHDGGFIYTPDESIAEFSTNYVTTITRFTLPLAAEGDDITVRIFSNPLGTFYLRNVLIAVDPSNLSVPKIDSRSSLLSGPQVTIGASPINSDVFTSVSSLEEREINVSLSNIDRYFSDILRPGYFRERLIGRVSFVEQGFLESGVKRVAFTGRCVRYNMSRDSVDLTFRGT